MSKFPIVNWNLQASHQLQKAYKIILEDSFINAVKVRDDISEIIDGLPKHPERYELDKWKRDNPGNYRAFRNTLIG